MTIFRFRQSHAISICFLLFLPWISAFTQDSVLAVLEDSPSRTEGASSYRSVRVAFFHTRQGWKPFPAKCTDFECLRNEDRNLDQTMEWIVGFDGRTIGEISTDFQETVGEAMLRGQFKVHDGTVPTVGKPMPEFAGWLGSPALRPLVLNSLPFVSDPDRWKPVALPKDDLDRLRTQFKKKYRTLTNCETMDAKSYSVSAIRVAKSYASKRNWRVVQLAVKGCAKDDERGDPLSTEWYVVSPEKRVTFLDSNIRLVDAGDYDHDGKSELVFFIDDYNRGGYKLFYNDFHQRAVFDSATTSAVELNYAARNLPSFRT